MIIERGGMEAPDLSGVMSTQEFQSWYMSRKNDHWHQSQMPIEMGILETLSNVTPRTIREMLDGKKPARLYSEALEKLSDAARDIDGRRVIWRVGKLGRYEFSYILANARRGFRVRLHPHISFNPLAFCASCHGDKWLPAQIDGKAHVLCYSCLPPDQWPSLGATPEKFSLIARFMEEENARLRLPESSLPQGGS